MSGWGPNTTIQKPQQKKKKRGNRKKEGQAETLKKSDEEKGPGKRSLSGRLGV